ncbi:hypothetical protein V8E53_002371 [Lactarius tabidus]
MLSSMTLFLCKTLLLLLGIIGFEATLLEIKEGLVTFLILQLQNKHEHHPFHHGYRAHMDWHKCNSPLTCHGSNNKGMRGGAGMAARPCFYLCKARQSNHMGWLRN